MRFRLFGGALLVLACGNTSVRDAALQDDLPAFKEALARAQKRGELSQGDVESVARALVERELTSSRGDTAVARVRDVRACIGAVESTLDDLSERRDAGGGAAMLALVDSGRSSEGDLVSLYAEDSDPVWRSVGARAAMGCEHGQMRRALLLDDDLRVRRAALYAARAEVCAEDRAALIEAARLDPDPLSRSVAVQALGALGGPEVVLALMDLWQASDAETRQGIVDAWATEPTYVAGGEARLLATVEKETGLVRVVAARGLLQNESQHAPLARNVLSKAARLGPSDERRLALGFLPLDTEGVKELEEAGKSDDPSVAVAAARRLLRVEEKRKAARARLVELAKNDSTPVRRQAEMALAHDGDRSVLPALEKAQSSPDAEERRHAALALLALGDYPTAATGLADDVARVRTQVACAVLAAK